MVEFILTEQISFGYLTLGNLCLVGPAPSQQVCRIWPIKINWPIGTAKNIAGRATSSSILPPFTTSTARFCVHNYILRL